MALWITSIICGTILIIWGTTNLVALRIAKQAVPQTMTFDEVWEQAKNILGELDAK